MGRGSENRPARYKWPRRTEKELHKELKAAEKAIAQLDAHRKQLATALDATTHDTTFTRLEAELADVSAKLADAEDQWAVLNEELGESEE